MIGLILIARHVADALKVDLDEHVAEICRATNANRTSAYEQADRILARMLELAEARPGRPAAPGEAAADESVVSLELAVKVLSYRLEHPGSVVPQQGRSFYSPAFQRFILTQADRWQGTFEAFAAAVRVPSDTLRDWLRRDRAQELPMPQVKRPVLTPRNASALVRDIAGLCQRWQGPTRALLGEAARQLRISPGQVQRVLKILGVISARRRNPFRHRGATHRLCPGALLVTDGKRLDVELTSSGQLIHLNWQAMVDQTTGCDTASVLTNEECAAGVAGAFHKSLISLGGVAPEGLLHDNKPCYDDQQLQRYIHEHGTLMIPATPNRAENKAILEGAFGLFEQRVGTIRLDDTNPQTLVSSAVEEVLRAYTAATNSVPRIELDGSSRLHVLQESCPSFEQQQRDLAFLARLKADHSDPKRRRHAPDPTSATLLDEVFSRLGLLDNDPNGSLRRYLTAYEPAAIRRAAVIVLAKLERDSIDRRYAHRYLTKVIQSQQGQRDLERAADELLHLCETQRECWTKNEESEHLQLLSLQLQPQGLAQILAENAAHGGIPLQSAFWTSKLLDLLRNAAHIVASVTKHLVRLFEAPAQNRLTLIDLITAQEAGLS